MRDGVLLKNTDGTTVEPYVVIAQAGTASNDLRPRTNPVNYTDPNVNRLASSIIYQLYDVAGLQPGTYMAYAYANPVAGQVPGFNQPTAYGFVTFQVGTATVDKKVATNCQTCHGDTMWHLDAGPIHPEPFDTDYCLACHDYGTSGTGEGYAVTGGNSTSGWAGYGAKPLSARLHGVHFGAYLNRPEDVYAGDPSKFADVIFSQDVRNCSTCHSADTTGTWKSASKLACTGCHDGFSTSIHILINTPARVELCDTCHGAGKPWAADTVHNISNPYEPIYGPREGYVIGD
jgi:OmcA/MtrC family decaheme c-type cytochrome